jgi:hypothetical protein
VLPNDTVEFPCVVVLHLLHIGVQPLNLVIQSFNFPMQLGILFLLSAHFVATKKRIDAVECCSSSLRDRVLALASGKAERGFGNLTLAAIFPDLHRAFRPYCFVFPRNAFIDALCCVNSPKLLFQVSLFP